MGQRRTLIHHQRPTRAPAYDQVAHPFHSLGFKKEWTMATRVSDFRSFGAAEADKEQVTTFLQGK